LWERLRRIWVILVEGWWLWRVRAGYAALMFYVAINPLVDPLMPDRGKYKIIGVYPASFALVDGDAADGISFVLLWLPIVYFVIRFPFWLRGQREWERKAVIRRAREKAKRDKRRAEREASRANEAASGMADAENPGSIKEPGPI